MTPNNAAETRNPGTIEFEPPLACVRRILKNTLPSSTNVGKDASAAYARAAGIFVIYITACANDFARENRRQTITANDVLAAIKVSESLSRQLGVGQDEIGCTRWNTFGFAKNSRPGYATGMLTHESRLFRNLTLTNLLLSYFHFLKTIEVPKKQSENPRQRSLPRKPL